MVSGVEVFENIVLVNKDDVFIGTLGKRRAHREGFPDGAPFASEYPARVDIAPTGTPCPKRH